MSRKYIQRVPLAKLYYLCFGCVLPSLNPTADTLQSGNSSQHTGTPEEVLQSEDAFGDLLIVENCSTLQNCHILLGTCRQLGFRRLLLSLSHGLYYIPFPANR